MPALRFGLGASRAPLGPRPERPLELYEFEACPFCRKVREAISLLDLPTRIWPCPKGGARFRPRAAALAGKASFPTLVDPNQPEGRQVMQESDRIVEVLFARYGQGPAPALLRAGALGNALSGLTSATRPGRGRDARPRRDGEPRLELHAPEGLAEARPVRELLCELELPYLLRPFASDGAPVLLDAGARLTGARAICAHLEARHA
jgi:glutathione S-transferase